ncbi:hypothetical protein AVEN_254507-1 [Araneus ventricosus]|uniref:Uncharacterized protein n=1 Tax=Araneus ventricosus TaxID=182803 RepID=A0A4Y2RKR9_ARAVE|nr:hypothetical protein AVEN_254507-1 [Araneus ventricosus]
MSRRHTDIYCKRRRLRRLVRRMTKSHLQTQRLTAGCRGNWTFLLKRNDYGDWFQRYESPTHVQRLCRHVERHRRSSAKRATTADCPGDTDVPCQRNDSLGMSRHRHFCERNDYGRRPGYRCPLTARNASQACRETTTWSLPRAKRLLEHCPGWTTIPYAQTVTAPAAVSRDPQTVP